MEKCIFSGCIHTGTKKIHFHFVGAKIGESPLTMSRDFGPLCDNHSQMISYTLQQHGLNHDWFASLTAPMIKDGYIMRTEVSWVQRSIDRAEDTDLTPADCIRKSSKASLN